MCALLNVEHTANRSLEWLIVLVPNENFELGHGQLLVILLFGEFSNRCLVRLDASHLQLLVLLCLLNLGVEFSHYLAQFEYVLISLLESTDFSFHTLFHLFDQSDKLSQSVRRNVSVTFEVLDLRGKPYLQLLGHLHLTLKLSATHPPNESFVV